MPVTGIDPTTTTVATTMVLVAWMIRLGTKKATKRDGLMVMVVGDIERVPPGACQH